MNNAGGTQGLCSYSSLRRLRFVTSLFGSGTYMNSSSARLAEFDYLICQHGGDIDAAFHELESFIQELQDDMMALDRQTKRQDAMAVASIAYRLKSSAKLRGIDLLHQSAIQIEQSARRNRMGQLNAEIDLMRYQVELLAQSAYLQREALDNGR